MTDTAKMYAVICEYNGGYVGTLSEIEEWMGDNDVVLSNCRFWELGSEVNVRLEAFE